MYDPLTGDAPKPQQQQTRPSAAGLEQPPPTPAKEHLVGSSVDAAHASISSVPPRPPLGNPDARQWPAPTSQPFVPPLGAVAPTNVQTTSTFGANRGPAPLTARPRSPGEPRSPYAASSVASTSSHHQHLLPPESPPLSRPAPRPTLDDGGTKPAANGGESLKIRIHGFDRTRKETWVKMDATTNMSSYHASHIKPFSRSFAEFVNLHAALAGNHPEAILPALPLIQTSAATDEEEDRLIKASFQRWVDRVCRHADLLHDDELRTFVEANFGYTPLSTKRRPTSAGLSKFKRTAPEESDELGVAKSELTKLEVALNDASRFSEKECNNRRALGAALHAVSEQLAAFSTTEPYRPLATGLRRFSDGIRRNGDLMNGVATAEGVALSDGLAYEAAEAREGKETLLSRQSTVDEYRNAVKTTITKQRQVERLKGGSSIKRDRADDALDQLDDAQKTEAMYAQQLQAISQKLAPSIRGHTQQLQRDLLHVLARHGKVCLDFEQQMLRDLEALQPDLKAIVSRTVNEVTYKHSNPVASAPGSPASQRTLALPPRDSADGGGSPARRRSPSLSQSVIVPPTHSLAASRSPADRVSTLAASVYLPGGQANRGRPGEKIADERQRVDARMAASKLANLF